MIKDFLQQYRKPITIAGIGLVALGAVMLFQFLQFRVVGTTPKVNNYPESLGVLQITFNRDLDTTDLKNRFKDKASNVIEANFDSSFTLEPKGKVLTIYISKTPLAGKYTLRLKDIAAADGATLSKTFTMNIKTIDYNKLSKEEKALYDANSSIVDDEHDAEYPLLTKLPYETANYMISYRFNHADPAPTIIITMKFFPPGNNAVPATAEQQATYVAQIRTYRGEALKWIQSQGASIDDYIMEYTETEIQNEFPAGHSKAFDGEVHNDDHDHDHSAPDNN